MSYSQLTNSWKLWYHSPNNSDWSINSYGEIMEINNIETCKTICTQFINENLLTSCMFFIMKNNIKPVWEDDNNKSGGCFSFKLQNKIIHSSWKTLVYKVLGNTLFKDADIQDSITGLSISPKKYFCIIKIWMKTCDNTDTSLLDCDEIPMESCIFKKHQE